ncbi:hypothetical protein ROSA5918_24160 [Roseateles saccharophilus]|uniref:Uncharacterized protein n=2 Tax=Roseateles saccharophilus TaxID=304 RepID=A0A4R3UA10_ROSSA|nr:hypothetical protein EV671_105411 [Roseateles saccharophilus]
MVLPEDPERRRKADFLLAKREVVLELKTLAVDTSHKVEAAVDKHRERDEFPLFFRTADVRKVLSHLPDGEDIYRRIVNSIGRSVEEAVRSAEEQVTHTRHVLGIPNAIGMLVILNESVEILDPVVVGHRVVQLMRRERTGNSDAEMLDFVWLLFESHALGIVGGVPAMPSMLIRGERAARFPWFTAFHADVAGRWAALNNGVVVDGGSPDPKAMRFSGTRCITSSLPTESPRGEVWRREYRARPYLRHLGDDAVLAHGGTLMQRLMPHFMKEGPGYVAEVVMPLMEQFTHFQEEASFRALDLRKMPKPG